MTDTETPVQETYALVVGIEKYAAGQEWNLNGPARDACRFTDWLRRRGVPDVNISLFLAPLEEHSVLVTASVPQVRPATSDNIYRALNEEFRRQEGALLYLFWGGHGFITAEGTRRLFYADATAENSLNLNLNSLLTTLRSEDFAGFRRQICIVDTCSNFVESLRLDRTLPHQTFSQSQPTPANQFVLLAGKAGDLAKNLDAEQTGLFSREVLTLLASEPADRWPPDMIALTTRLQERFSALRNERATDQTPNYFSYRDWDGNEGTLGQPSITSTAGVETPPTPVAPPALSLTQLWELVDALLACPAIANPNRRETVLQQMRREIAGMISRDTAARFDVFNIVTTCLNYSGGIAELVAVVRGFEGLSQPMQHLEQVVHTVPLVA